MGNIDILAYDYCEASISRLSRLTIVSRYKGHLFRYKGGQVTKPIILVKICYKLLYVIQLVENSFGK